MKKRLHLFLLMLGAAMLFAPATCSATGDAENDMRRNIYLTESTSIKDMVNHPAFSGFGEHLLPRPQDATSDLPLREVGRLMPWHSHIQPTVVLQAINRMISDISTGKKVFYNFYDAPQKQRYTGLFFFRGKKGAPFALICPGGGFAYIGSMHEGFPLAEELSRMGYNAFVLQYRTGGEVVACEDMAAAVSWIFAQADTLGVSTQNYSVWGGSAGARMAANLGSYGASAFGGQNVPRPAAVVMAYTGHSRYTNDDPPTFAVVSSDDPIASPLVMKRRIDSLKHAGINAEFHLYHHAGHGFGTGTGTDAEGWMEKAVHFWEQTQQ